mgnify:CR=1 FL=1
MIPKGKLAVVSNDAGGAEILSSFIRQNIVDFVTVVDGPAKKYSGIN